MQRSGNNDGDPQMKRKLSTFNRHEDVCTIEVLTHKLLTLVINDSVRYASTPHPCHLHSRRKRRRYPPDTRLGVSRSRYGLCAEKTKYVTYRVIRPCVFRLAVAYQNVWSLRNPQRHIRRGGLPYL